MNAQSSNFEDEGKTLWATDDGESLHNVCGPKLVESIVGKVADDPDKLTDQAMNSITVDPVLIPTDKKYRPTARNMVPRDHMLASDLPTVTYYSLLQKKISANSHPVRMLKGYHK